MKAEYVDHMGSDLTVVNAARVSFDKHHDVLDEDRDPKLIKYLAAHGHWTPFAHPQITIRETVPVFVARQRFKHVIGFIYNEVSRRYVDDTPEFYWPDGWRARPEGNLKQGSGGLIDEDDMTVDPPTALYKRAVYTCVSAYQEMLLAGVAPEQARMVLPQSMFTSYYVTGSLAAWARAYKLRIDPHAQVEIQELAKQWNGIIEPLFPVSWACLISANV